MNNTEYAKDFTSWQKRNKGYALRLFSRYYSIFISRFDWKGLPDGMLSRYIEKVLFFQGQAVFFKDNKLGYLCLPCADQGYLNAYFEPTKFNVIGNRIFNSVTTDNGVWVRNDMLARPACLEVQFYAERIADVERTIDTNLMYHKIPIIFKTSDKKLLTSKNIFRDIESNKPVLYLNDDPSFDIEKSLITEKSDIPFIIDRLYDYKNELVAELNSLLGIKSGIINKEGGISPTEIDVGEGPTTDGYIAAMLETRKTAAEQINSIFPELNVTVDLKKEIKENELYNDVGYGNTESFNNIGNPV